MTGARRVLLALGSNLGDRAGHLRGAVAALGDEVVGVSAVYETPPVGGPEQGPYLNAVVALNTVRSARDLLAWAHELEAAAERVRIERWGPRTLDVDVLWIDGEVVDEPDLVVPHPRMFERAFVLVPLADVAPDLVPADPPTDPAITRVAGPGAIWSPEPRRVRIVGRGRAGGSLAGALTAVGWEVEIVPGRAEVAAEGADLVVLAVPDGAIAAVAAAVTPGPAVVAHLSGSLGLDVLAPHERRASIHPLVALPTPEVGAERLRAGAWCAVAGDPIATTVVEALGARAVTVPDEQRAAYHAAACIASNHLVALLGQVERVAAGVGVPLEAYLDLARATVENVAALGPAAALTGPAARGDTATLDRHRAALPDDERPAYDAMVALAERLAGRAR